MRWVKGCIDYDNQALIEDGIWFRQTDRQMEKAVAWLIDDEWTDGQH
jgi:hypothetical protein